jgi:UDP-glucuronate decarboxylase
MHPNDGRVVSNFIMQALKGEAITLYGDGEQTRSFCFVSDLVDGLIRLMNSDDDFTGPANLGNPNEFTIRQLAETISELTETNFLPVYKDLPSDDPMQRKPDITIARDSLGWEPTVQLREGLQLSIPYFRGLVEAGH